jgi:polymorphic membrane protein
MKKLAICSALTLAAFLFSSPSHAAPVPVTSLDDNGAFGTLRYVLKYANDGDVIQVPGGVIILKDAGATALDTDGDDDLDIVKNVTIQGSTDPANPTVIDANGPTTGARVFEIDSDGKGVGAIIQGVTIQNGQPCDNGGGIKVDYPGSLELYDSTVTGNDDLTCGNYDGGAIYVDGTGSIGGALIVGNSTLSNNRAYDGGAVYIYYTSSATLKNSTVSNNHADEYGGGIENYYGDLDLIDTKVTDNEAPNDEGGGFYNYAGSAQITGSSRDACQISRNSADDYGGGIFNFYGTILFDNCNINENHLTSTGGYGAGISNDYSSGYPLIHMKNSTVSKNVSEGYGGGIYNSDYAGLFIENSTISQNVAKSGYGGGIYNDYYATLSLTDSVVDGNAANDCCGGGVYTYGYATIDHSAITNNTVLNSYYGGGGLYNVSTYATVVANSTIAGNQALGDDGSDETNGGGVFNEADYTLMIVNTTIANNRADGHGGGIYNDYYGIQLNNVTITGNTADANSGGLSGGDGGGIWNNDGYSIQLSNSIVAGNVDNSPGHEAPDCLSDFTGNTDAFTLVGPNIIQSTNGCEVLGDTNRLTTGDPQLDSAGLADNNGPSIGDPDSPVILQTIALASGSPAIDAGEDEASETSDERGVARPIDGNGDGTAKSDLGAFEAAAPSGGTTGGTTTGGTTTGGSTGGSTTKSGGCSLVR